MPALPEGDPVPVDGALPASALERLGAEPFGIYVHVPWCASRCGYCDFNTYVPRELAGAGPETFAEDAIAELRLARVALGTRELPVGTVFFGGGTPTLLPPTELSRILAAIRSEFGLMPGAEVTTEANPESLSPAVLEALRGGGFSRLSIGMQSASSHVLAELERSHTPASARRAVRWASAAGFEHINLDLIYGAPAETDSDWLESLAVAIDAGIDHVSAYALTVEPGTRLAGQVARGSLPAIEEDVLARRYELADRQLSAAGLDWYEISNWSRPGGRCRHNEGYWRGSDWWGIGPGAHSHVGGTRWWNSKHPRAYRAAVQSGRSPGAGREILSPAEAAAEQVMLGVRLRDGLAIADVPVRWRAAVLAAARQCVAAGLAEAEPLGAGQSVLTLRGRLLADTVTRRLWDAFS